MKCPSCGNKGQNDGQLPGGDAAFELRGRLQWRLILRCLRCNGGVFHRMVPPRSQSIPAEQWNDLDRFWQLRRAEILADLQARLAFGAELPSEEEVAESQAWFAGDASRQQNLIHSMRIAGYETTVEQVRDLLDNQPVEFSRIALTARQQNVVYDQYQEWLAQGGVAQTEQAAARIASAKRALEAGEDGIRAFLSNA
jgi:hypothetical protein